MATLMLTRRSLLTSTAAMARDRLFPWFIALTPPASCPAATDHRVPGANEPLPGCPRGGGQGEGRSHHRLHHHQGDELALTATAEGQRDPATTSCSSRFGTPPPADDLKSVNNLVTALIKVHGNCCSATNISAGSRAGGSRSRPACRPRDRSRAPHRLFQAIRRFNIARMYPVGAPPDKALTDAWTWDRFLVAAQKRRTR